VKPPILKAFLPIFFFPSAFYDFHFLHIGSSRPLLSFSLRRISPRATVDFQPSLTNPPPRNSSPGDSPPPLQVSFFSKRTLVCPFFRSSIEATFLSYLSPEEPPPSTYLVKEALFLESPHCFFLPPSPAPFALRNIPPTPLPFSFPFPSVPPL